MVDQSHIFFLNRTYESLAEQIELSDKFYIFFSQNPQLLNLLDSLFIFLVGDVLASRAYFYAGTLSRIEQKIAGFSFGHHLIYTRSATIKISLFVIFRRTILASLR